MDKRMKRVSVVNTISISRAFGGGFRYFTLKIIKRNDEEKEENGIVVGEAEVVPTI